MTKLRDYGTVKETIARLIKSAGGYKRVADLLDRSKTVVYGYFDPDATHEISFASVVKITRFTGATEAAEMLAHEAGGVFMPGVPTHANADLGGHTKRIIKESAEVVGTMVDALSTESELPGDMTPTEATETLRELDELVSVLMIARASIARRAKSDNGGGTHAEL